jgi:DNA/RNA-binding domain of Phe-tRNA-synthetase-like protein
MEIDTAALSPSNEHPDFHIRGMIASLDPHAAVPGKEEVQSYVEEVRSRLTAEYGEMERRELKALPMFVPYIHYFKRFKKSYHLFLQLESFVHKGRGMPFVNPLLSAYFLGELESGVLASAHDADLLRPPLKLVWTAGQEQLVLISGEERQTPAGDAALTDAESLLTAVTQGQDRRSVLTPASRTAAWFFYGPPGTEPQQLERAMEITAGHLRNMGAAQAETAPL